MYFTPIRLELLSRSRTNQIVEYMYLMKQARSRQGMLLMFFEKEQSCSLLSSLVYGVDHNKDFPHPLTRNQA